MGEASKWRKLFGLEKPKAAKWAPAARPGHSMTGRVVTGVAPDWSRYDGCMSVNVVGESYYQPALIRVSKCPARGEHGYECSAVLVLDPERTRMTRTPFGLRSTASSWAIYLVGQPGDSVSVYVR